MVETSFLELGGSSTELNSYIRKALANTLNEDTYFELDEQTINSLEFLPKLRSDGLPDKASMASASSRSYTTVYSVINKCRTASGSRLLSLWMRNPLKSKEKIDLRLSIVEYLAQNTEMQTVFYVNYLKRIPDLLKLAFRISKEKCNLGDLMKVYFARDTIRNLCENYRQILKFSETEPPQGLQKLFDWIQSSLDNLSDFVQLIDDSIDVSNVDESGEFLVKPNSNENIAKISLEINTWCTQARRILRDAAEDTGLEADTKIKLETDPEKGFCMKVTKNNEPSIRGNSNYEQLNMVKKDGYRFTTSKLIKLSTKYVNSKEEYNSLAKFVIEDIVSKAVMYSDEVLEFSVATTLIDVFTSLAVAAVQHNYVRPLILDSEAEKIYFDKLRHPCVECQPDIENYVPNDLIMGKDDKKFYLITGPNMGGKSTFIKAVAINVLMAQCGCMIPADEGRISIVDGVYTRVGAGDRQMEGVSTFMGEMLDMASILKKATSNSLVVIDELGRGTSTFDGFGLAWSISKHLSSNLRSFTLFATHFHELTELEQEEKSVGNLHVKAFCNSEKLTMLFDVGKGVCDESYGINVAQFTKFPDHVVQCAKSKLRQYEEVPGFSDKNSVREFVKDCAKNYKELQFCK